jgi:hypothetical protein
MAMQTNRSVGAAAAAAVALVTALLNGSASASIPAPTEPGAAPSACRIRVLAVPDGTISSRVTAGDPSGRTLVGQIQDSAGFHGAVWEDRVPRLLDLPPGEVELTSVSRNGTIGGYLWSGPTPGGFVLTPDGEFHAVTAPGGAPTDVEGVTDEAAAAGSVYQTGTGSVPRVWAPGAYDQPITRRVPGDRPVLVAGMTPSRAIVATTGLDDLPYRTYLWGADGDRVRLAGTTPDAWVAGTAVASRWAAGKSTDRTTGQTQVVRWRLPSGRVSAVPGAGPWGEVTVFAVNRHGVIGGGLLGGPGVLIIGDDLVELPTLGGAAGVSTVASNGQPAGDAHDGTESAAVTWRCG